MNPYIQGLLLQASLILALGAQNIFILESGLKRQRHLFVAFVCSICDTLLIFAGVVGAASLFLKFPILKLVFGLLGVGFLAFYGIKKLREAFSSQVLVLQKSETPPSLRRVLWLTLGFSLLNPHVYLDALILVGGYSAQFSDLWDRLEFGAGAASFSVVWFYALSLFASLLSSWLQDPKRLKMLSLVSGLVLITLAVKLALEL